MPPTGRETERRRGGERHTQREREKEASVRSAARTKLLAIKLVREGIKARVRGGTTTT